MQVERDQRSSTARENGEGHKTGMQMAPAGPGKVRRHSLCASRPRLQAGVRRDDQKRRNERAACFSPLPAAQIGRFSQQTAINVAGRYPTTGCHASHIHTAQAHRTGRGSARAGGGRGAGDPQYIRPLLSYRVSHLSIYLFDLWDRDSLGREASKPPHFFGGASQKYGTKAPRCGGDGRHKGP